MIENAIQIICVYAIPLIFAITLHEAAHGWAAKKLGDDTAWILGRVTANPVPHIDPVGTVLVPGALVLMSALTGGAGFVFGWAVVLKLVVMLGISERFVISVCAAGISVNLMLMAFNLIPIPPLDGGRILRGLLPSSGRSLLDRIEPYGMVILVVLMAGGGLGFFARPFLEAGRWLVELVL